MNIKKITPWVRLVSGLGAAAASYFSGHFWWLGFRKGFLIEGALALGLLACLVLTFALDNIETDEK